MLLLEFSALTTSADDPDDLLPIVFSVIWALGPKLFICITKPIRVFIPSFSEIHQAFWIQMNLASVLAVQLLAVSP